MASNVPAMKGKPFPQSFWVDEGLLCAGHYPGHPDPAERDAKLTGLLDCGIRLVLSLMAPSERSHGGRAFEPYVARLQELAAEQGAAVECQYLPIPDGSVPTRSAMQAILDTLAEARRKQIPTYLHCWGGHGRTSTVIACYLIQQGSPPQQAIEAVRRWRAGLPKSHQPFEGGQEQFVRSWTGRQS